MTNLPWGFTNTTRADGDTVTKTFDGPRAVGRHHAELACLTAFTGRLPVPPVLSADDRRIRTRRVRGACGTDLLDAASPTERIFTAAGALLRRVTATPPPAGLHGDGPVLVHGDFGPQNLLVDDHDWTITAVVDWEWARTGPEVFDAAWFEWIIRYHHRELVGELPVFFAAAFDRRPAWPLRHRLMIDNARGIAQFARERGTGHAEWLRRLNRTYDFGPLPDD